MSKNKPIRTAILKDLSKQDYASLLSERDELKKEVERLKDLVNEIQDKWISASHYWGSATHDKSVSLLKK